jgi:hypothetical protein
MEKSVFCIVPSEALALTIVNNLRLAGFCNTDVSMLFPDQTGAHGFAGQSDSQHEQSVGGALGWLAGIGILSLPERGPHVAAGPIVQAFGKVSNLAAGAIVAALVTMGLSEPQARHYDAKLREGNILVSVQSDERGQRERAREILTVGGASEVIQSKEQRPERDSRMERVSVHSR